MTKIRLLAIEDSGYMLMALRAMVKLDPAIEIIGEAQNGIDGVAMALDLMPDVITMDVNMPGLNGIEATQRIMAERPTSIITLSSMTERGKAITAQAFAAGAVDFIPKSMSAADVDLATITRQVTQKIRFWGEHAGSNLAFTPPTIPTAADLILCAGGAGSPPALAALLRDIPSRVTAPILVSFEMLPVALLDPFVDYLGRSSNRTVRPATHRGTLEAGVIAVIPGGRKARVERNGRDLVTLLSADPTADLLASAAAAAQRPQIIFLSGDARPLHGLTEVAFGKPMIVALQDPSTCADPTLVEAVQQSSLPHEILSRRPEAHRTVDAA